MHSQSNGQKNSPSSGKEGKQPIKSFTWLTGIRLLVTKIMEVWASKTSSHELNNGSKTDLVTDYWKIHPVETSYLEKIFSREQT
jgi:hypothetical protein